MPSLSELHRELIAPAVETVEYFQLLTGGKRDVRGRVVGGVQPTITSVKRSRAKQEALYRTRASNPYPVNRPGDSAHEYGLAWDSDVPDAYMPLWIQVRQLAGWRVPENDEVHAEVPNWRELLR